MRGLKYILRGEICRLKGSHEIYESDCNGNMFSIHIKTECLRCKLDLYLSIDSSNEEYVVSEDGFFTLEEMRGI